MDPPDPVGAIKFRMEQQGLTRKDLEQILGTRTRVAEVLNRRRGLSINMIRRLHETLGISADVLIRQSRSRKVAQDTVGGREAWSRRRWPSTLRDVPQDGLC